MDTWVLAGKLLSKPPEERCKEEIKPILPWFKQRSQLFTNLEDERLCDVVKNVKLLKVRRDFVIMRQGEVGDCFYIILKGSVSVYAKKEEEGESYILGYNDPANETQYVKSIKERITRFGAEIIQFKNGCTFGEMVFMSERKERSATVISDEPTELITVDEPLYRRCLHTYNPLWQEKYSFAHGSPLFASWGSAYKSLLAESLTPVKVNFGSSLVTQGQPCNSLFMVAKGMGTVIVDSNLSSKQYRNLKPKASANKEEEIGKVELKKDYSGPLTVIQRRRRRNALGYAAMESRLKLRQQSVATIGVNAIIGDIEFILDLPTYSASVVCAESLEVYEIDKQNFQRIIAKKNFETLEYLKQIVMAKLEFRSKRFPHVSLYPWLVEYANLKLNDQMKGSTKRNKLRRYTPAFLPTATGAGETKKAGLLSAMKRRQTVVKQKSASDLRGQDGVTAAATSAGSVVADGKRLSEQKEKDKKLRKSDAQKSKQYTPEEFRVLKKKMQAQGKMIIRSQEF